MAGPLQSVAPVAGLGGLNALALLQGGLDLPPAPANLAAAPALALTPAQITTLTSGNVTSMNQLLGQLVSGTTSNQALATLVNTLVTPPSTVLPSALTPVAALPAPPSPPVVVTPPPVTTPPTPPVITPPINYVSRS